MDEAHWEVIGRILFIHAKLNPGLGYVQASDPGKQARVAETRSRAVAAQDYWLAVVAAAAMVVAAMVVVVALVVVALVVVAVAAACKSVRCPIPPHPGANLVSHTLVLPSPPAGPQGMNEILGPIYYVLATDPDPKYHRRAEADAFWCFTALMAELRDVFIKTLDDSSTGVGALMARLVSYLEEVDAPLARAMDEMKLMPQFYAFRWMTLLLSQEFQLPDVRCRLAPLRWPR